MLANDSVSAGELFGATAPEEERMTVPADFAFTQYPWSGSMVVVRTYPLWYPNTFVLRMFGGSVTSEVTATDPLTEPIRFHPGFREIVSRSRITGAPEIVSADIG